MSIWKAYQPNDALPWDLRRVVHLHRRAAFGASWPEIERDLREGPQASIARVLNGSTTGGWGRSAAQPPASRDGLGAPAGRPQPPQFQSPQQISPDDFENVASVIGGAAVDSGSPERLKAWWVYRCLFSPHPLQERLTLMWHNHFATSNLKLNDLRLVKQQNETFRRLALAPFGELLSEMSHDPALLEWLDAPSNRKGHPNENLARELMELFTLGIGHYTEDDVKQAARTLTGRSVKQGQYRDQPAAHDDGEKTILGRTGNFGGDDLVRLLLDHPATSRRLAWRLTGEFCGEQVVDAAALDELAAGLREHHLDIRWAVETILRSELFFRDGNIGTRISDPVSFLLHPLRALECQRDPPSTLVLAEWVGRMGQDLFYPPNVGGWNGGRTWLSTRTVIARANCMAALIAGGFNTPARPIDLGALVAKYSTAGDAKACTEFLSQLLYGQVREEASGGSAVTPAIAAGQSQLASTVIAMLTGPQAFLH